MTDIDYDKLRGDATNTYLRERAEGEDGLHAFCRAVVAALRDQGLVVVRADDAERAMFWYGWAFSEGATGQDDDDARGRINAALPQVDGQSSSNPT